MSELALLRLPFRLGVIYQCRICGAYTNEAELGGGEPPKIICLQAREPWHNELMGKIDALKQQSLPQEEQKQLKKEITRIWSKYRSEVVNNVKYIGLARFYAWASEQERTPENAMGLP